MKLRMPTAEEANGTANRFHQGKYTYERLCQLMEEEVRCNATAGNFSGVVVRMGFPDPIVAEAQSSLENLGYRIDVSIGYMRIYWDRVAYNNAR